MDNCIGWDDCRIMRIFKEPQLFSNYIALCALLLTVFKLLTKTHNETVEKVGKLYGKIFSTLQQLKGQVLSVNKLSENIAQFSEKEVIGYVNSYLRNEDLVSSIHEIESLILPSFNLKEELQEKNSVKKIFDFTSLVISLDESITAFYQGILAGSKYQVSEILNIYIRMNNSLIQIEKNEAQEVVGERLTYLHKKGYCYYLILIVACILAFFLLKSCQEFNQLYIYLN